MQRHVRFIWICTAALWAVPLAGAFLPGPFTWGFHFLAYLPLPFRIVYALAAAASLILLSREAVARSAERLLARAGANPIPLLAATILIFLVAAVALRVAVPLLGDSFIAIKLYENRAGGPPFLPNSHYPIAFFYFFSIMKWMGSFSFPRIMDAFLVGEMILGAGFIAAVWYTARTVFDDARMQAVAFFLLVFLPALQLYFGYVEIYAASQFFLSVYLLGAALTLKQKLPFVVLPSLFLLLVLAHYLNLLLLPSLLFLALAEYRRNGTRSLGTGLAAAAAVALAAYSLAGIEASSLLPAPRHSPFLSITAVEDIYQAYTLFSVYHGIDLLNLLFFLFSSGLILVAVALPGGRIFRLPLAAFLAVAVVPVLCFLAVAKFDLPMAQDWDIAAPYAVIVMLLGLLAVRERFGDGAPRLLLLVLPVALFNSFAWFSVNAGTDPSVARASSFIDTRISSQDGTYQSTLHFVEYHLARGDAAEVARAFERFLELYPTDKRGYANYALHLMQFGEGQDATIRALFERWMRLDPSSAEARGRYADFLLDIGHRQYKEGLVIEAGGNFEAAIRLNPSLAEAYNGLGVIYRKSGDLDRAIEFYERAAALDSVNVYAFINLGNLYDDRGDPERAVAYYRKAIRLQPNAADAYYNLGITYERTGSQKESLEALRQAARLGMNDAQQLLRSKGEQW